MPSTWTLDAPAAGHTVSAAVVHGLLEVASAPLSAARLLRAIQQVVPVQYLSLVAFRRHMPELIEGSSRDANGRDVVAECFA
ncbi:MAG: LuxR family transcriptional regulator, partial [Lysobacteraceae bacterium]